MILSRYTIFSLIVFSLYGCTASTSALDMVEALPVYDGGYDIDKRKLGSESYQQLFYRLNEAYPSINVLNYYKEYFLKYNWRECKNNTNEWESFIDATITPGRSVHQVIHYWIKKNESKLGIISLRYYSESRKSKSIPDNNVQNVFVLMQRGLDNLENELSRLSLDCN